MLGKLSYGAILRRRTRRCRPIPLRTGRSNVERAESGTIRPEFNAANVKKTMRILKV